MTFSNMKTALVLLAAFGLVGSGAGWLALGHGEERLPAAAEPQAKATAPAKDDRETRTTLIERLKKQQHMSAAEAEEVDLNLSEKLVQARQRLAEAEDQVLQAEADMRSARVPGLEEVKLREELVRLQIAVSEAGAMSEKVGDAMERARAYAKAHAMAEVERRVKLAQKEREVTNGDHPRRLQNLRRQVIRQEEDVRLLERKRDLLRRDSDRRREAIAERIRQLEGFAEQGGDDRRQRNLERKLDSLQTTLDELSREVRRLRTGKKE